MQPKRSIVDYLAENARRTPQRIRFMDALPRTATGKVQRFKLREISKQSNWGQINNSG